MASSADLCLLPPEPPEGCCTPPEPPPAAPVRPYNTPGLEVIRYRIGTFTSFRRAMLEDIARADLMGALPNPFARWQEGADSDYQTMFVELWAYIADILTFYQERIANEAYLPTATQRDSLRRLAKLVLYRPAPGAGATAWIAFTVEKGKTVAVPTGFRVGSKAGPGKPAAVFETEKAVTARSEHSAIPVATTEQADQFDPSSDTRRIATLAGVQQRTIVLEGVRSRLVVGDYVLVVENEKSALERASLRQLTGVNPDRPTGTTTITWNESVGTSYTQSSTRLYALRVTAAPFGNSAAAWDTLPATLTGLAAYESDWDDSGEAAFYLPTPGDPPNVLSLDRSEEGVSVTAAQAAWAVLVTDSTPPALLTVPAPVAMLDGNGEIEVLAAGFDGALWHIGQTAPNNGWSGWTSLGGGMDARSPLAVGRNQGGGLEAFVLGTDGTLLHNRQAASGGAWSGWSTLGTPSATVGIQPVLLMASNADGRLELFTLGTDSALWHLWQTAANGGWSGWESLGGVLPARRSLTVGRNQDGRLEVFGVGTDGVIYHNRQMTPVTSGVAWSGWQQFGNPTPGLQIQTPLSVGINLNGRLDLFAMGADGALWHSAQTSAGGGGGAWTAQGQPQPGLTPQTGLHIGINADGRQELFAAGKDGTLWHLWQTTANGGWSGWASFSNVRPNRDAISVGKNQDGRLEVFTLDATGNLHTIWQTLPNNGWSGGASLGTPPPPPPLNIWASRLADARPASKAAYGLSSRVTRLTFIQPAIPALTFPLRNTIVRAGSEPLTLHNDLPLDDPLQGRTLTLIGQYPQLQAGQTVIVQGDLPPLAAGTSTPGRAAEVVTIDQAPIIDTVHNRTQLTLKNPLVNSYLHAGAVVLANAVEATQGETVKDEILGSGNGGALQTYALQKRPLTYLPATDAEGLAAVQSTLRVTVGGVRWNERSNLLQSASDAQDYTTEQDDTGQTSVIFGDGFFGARPPSGRDNIHAHYRKGLGTSGNVVAGGIPQMLDNLPGLQRVTNPQPSLGGVDAESAAQIRQNTPASLKTFGRAVSAADYAALARSYPGVAKASATWILYEEIAGSAPDQITLRTLPQPFLQLTIATANRTPLASQQPFAAKLHNFLDARRDPNVPLRFADFTPVFIEVEATIDVDDRFPRQATLARAQAALHPGQNPDGTFGYFAFERLDFGQSIPLSAVYAALQRVEGVRDAVITMLRRVGTYAAPGDILLRSTGIAMIGDDPTHPEQGHLTLSLGKGGFETHDP